MEKSHFLSTIEIHMERMGRTNITIGEAGTALNRNCDMAEKILNNLVNDGYMSNPVKGYYVFNE